MVLKVIYWFGTFVKHVVLDLDGDEVDGYDET